MVECMVKNMNKHEFINRLSNEIHYSIDDCIKINEILEKHFFLRQKNQEKIVNEFVHTFDITNTEAEHLYHCARKIIQGEVKEKLKHPFKSIDS